MAASSHLENILAAIQVPFPELTDLVLKSAYEMALVVPGTFLDGSAHRLRYFESRSVSGITEAGTHLVYIQLWNILRYG